MIRKDDEQDDGLYDFLGNRNISSFYTLYMINAYGSGRPALFKTESRKLPSSWPM
jgi:hypothetical protein